MEINIEKAPASGGGAEDATVDTEAAQRKFELVMLSISSEPAMSSFKGEYAKLLGALRASFVSERKLVVKVKALNEELIANSARVQQALRMSEEDGTTIDELRTQLERAWGIVETSNAKAESQAQSIESLTASNTQMSASLSRYTALVGEGLTVEDIVAAKESIEARLTSAETVIFTERARADGLVAELAVRSKKYKEKKDENKAQADVLKGKEDELAQSSRMRASMQADLASLKEQIADKMQQMDAVRRASDVTEGAKAKLAAALEAERSRTTSALSELSAAKMSASKSLDEVTNLKEKALNAAEATKELKAELHLAKLEIGKETAAGTKSRQKIETLGKEVEFAKAGLARAEESLAALRTELMGLGKSVEVERTAAKDFESKATRLNKEKAVAEKKASDAQSKVSTVQLESSALAAEVTALEAERKATFLDLQKARLVCASLERERSKMRSENEAMHKEISDRDDAIAMRLLQIAEVEKREADAQVRLKAAQTLYESTRAERNQALKSLAVGNEETSEIKRKSKIILNQLDSVKEEVVSKDKMLITEQFEVAALAKRLDQRAAEIEATRRLLHEASENVARQNQELGNSNLALRRADADMLTQKRSFDSLIAERDALAAALTRRNDEMALLHERSTIQSITLSKGEAQFQAATEECKVMRVKVAELKRDLSAAHSQSTGSGAELRRQLATVMKDLTSEQVKVSLRGERASVREEIAAV